MGEVQPHHGHIPISPEHDIGGLRVGIDVELGRRRYVATRKTSAHGDDPFHPLDDLRLLADGERDVGIGADGHERDRLRIMCHDRVDDEIDSVALIEFERRGRQHRPVETGFAVDLDGQNLFAGQRTGRTLGDRNLNAIGRANGKRIARRVLNIVVARNGGDAEKINVGIARREQDRDGVIVAGVAVEDDFFHGRGFRWMGVKQVKAAARGGVKAGGCFALPIFKRGCTRADWIYSPVREKFGIWERRSAARGFQKRRTAGQDVSLARRAERRRGHRRNISAA